MAFRTPGDDRLPAWTAAAIELLTPTLKIMAKPVVLNNLKRVAADPANPTQAELCTFVERVHHGIKTFGSADQADRLAAVLAHRLGVRWRAAAQ
ncbi:hypothetical protein J2Z79_000636 [Symbiobacterium terraclitae]|jgi:hypothetical protein|uniref:Uncharacterized protein n=1 Tax=Symbiobacterium terraclitae TaxID=557451 RepID=A0ABS4JNZ2_9FIRM|nr:hypothetical protein [Symbiobacterium terraclitae]MBP2017262.1 hypothetical protein [Symbiobacterium terraclitae]